MSKTLKILSRPKGGAGEYDLNGHPAAISLAKV